MADNKNVFGLVAAGAATLILLISMCSFGGIAYWNVMVLLAFLAGGLCMLIRLVDVLNSKGVMTMGFINDNKKIVAMLIVGTGIISAGFTLIAFIWSTVYVADSGNYWAGRAVFAYVCIILAGVAGLANVILGFLEVRDSGAPPAPAS